MKPALEIADATYHYPGQKNPQAVLDRVNLQIPEGKIFGLLGPNGAGKTTLMRAVSGTIEPQSGTIAIRGEARRRRHLADMGLLIENPGVYRKLNAREYLGFFGAFYHLSDLDQRMDTLAGSLDFEWRPNPVGQLSLGDRQKLHIIRTLLHRPSLLLWDEPFSHLDPHVQRKASALIKDYVSRTGATVLLATHLLEQAEDHITGAAIIHRGRIAYQGDPRNAPGDHRSAHLLFAETIDPARLDFLSEEHGVTTSKTGEGFLLSGVDLKEKLPNILREVCERGLPLVAAVPQGSSGLRQLYDQYVN